MSMSDLDLGALKALAEKATPGPWVVTGGDNNLYGVDAQDDYVTLSDSTLPVSDAEFIAAANPEVVLALIERVQAAEAVIAEVTEAWWSGTEPGDDGILYTDQVEAAMDAIWAALSRYENGGTDEGV